jgi:hypothetical protein
MSNILREGEQLRNQIYTNTPNLLKMLQDYYIRTNLFYHFFMKIFFKQALKQSFLQIYKKSIQVKAPNKIDFLIVLTKFINCILAIHNILLYWMK